MAGMQFPRAGDLVRVTVGGDCGLELRGEVSQLVLHRDRQGLVLRNSEGNQVTLYYEEMDDLVIEKKSDG